MYFRARYLSRKLHGAQRGEIFSVGGEAFFLTCAFKTNGFFIRISVLMSQKFVETQEVENYVIILEISDVPLEKNLPHCAAAPFSLMSGGRQPP